MKVALGTGQGQCRGFQGIGLMGRGHKEGQGGSKAGHGCSPSFLLKTGKLSVCSAA